MSSWEDRDRDRFDELLGRAFGRSPGRGVLRAADADRDAVAGVLRRAHGEGRITTDELEERLARCYAAKTFAELDRIVYDLPVPRPPEPARRRGFWPLHPILVALLCLAAIPAIFAGVHLWFLWPLLFFGWFRFVRGGRRWQRY